jgi:hypothetical protein
MITISTNHNKEGEVDMKKLLIRTALVLIHGTLLAGVAHGQDQAYYDKQGHRVTHYEIASPCVNLGLTKNGCTQAAIYPGALVALQTAAIEGGTIPFKDAGIRWNYRF